MNFADLVRTVLLNLKRMRFRVLLTVLGVVIGTVSVVLMIAIGAGMQRSITGQLDAFGSATMLTVYPEGQNPYDIMSSSTSRSRRLNDAALAEIERIPGVESVVGEHTLEAELVYRDKRTPLTLIAIRPSDLRVLGLPVSEGRLLEGGNELVIGDMVPAMLAGNFTGGDGPRIDVLRESVTVEPAFSATAEESAPRRLRLRVAGVLEAGDFDTDMSAYVPVTTVRSLLGAQMRRGYGQAVVQVEDPEDLDPVTAAITEAGFEPFSLRAQADAAGQVFVILQFVLGGIGGIALLVASLGIANTMTMATYERTREIGIMKAVGASRRQIKRVFLGESAAIGVLGGVIGLALSLALAGLGNVIVAPHLDGEALFYVPVWLGVFAVAFSALVGLAAGAVPASRAARLDPLVALRHE